ncbi:flagellar hook-associated protein FlgK [Pseudogracilibacillus auburnensis]|uniref:Flagellar hook-associated protein 1 n=1 Tax=Pseudogracilibacillus auburnensis TaxID=1494959 RepID=A0A2V3W8M6_9BACI|nr:flagellar hook-associated protein FlgK [Pseudogracilibacillus auburnensis]PXW89538.1 flagellar hook-associated protein 1 FlgK [Pseudogracilibacillus auburnensis]
MSTFQGLELAKKALFAQRGGLYTTGHNIANVNTEGYSRQRVNFETTTPFPVPSRVQPQIAGQMGTGVKIGTVQRIRDQFLDFQFRAENSRLGYWNTKQEALSRMEELLNEPSANGMNNMMDRFWQSLQDLADHPENSGARSVVAQRGFALAETYNHLSKSLQSIQADLKDQIDVSVKNINSLLRQINGLNEQIQKIEPHGFLANDLYDERDRLIDKLSEHMNIKVHYSRSSESALEIADGIASIEVLDSRGHSIGDGVFLIDARSPNTVANAVKEINVYPDNENSPITNISVDGEDLGLDLMKSNGSLSALIESFGYVDGDVKGTYPEMLAELDRMAAAFANEFNRVHRQGIDLNGDQPTIDFFIPKDGATEITAESITINPDILNNSDLIAAGDPDAGSRNADNALELAKVFENSLSDLGNTSTRKFFTALIGELGVKGQEAKSEKESSEILQAQVSHSRMSVSAVSLDEEISNLIKFQHAYNAAARSMTAIDELLDKIINQMGLVGR